MYLRCVKIIFLFHTYLNSLFYLQHCNLLIQVPNYKEKRSVAGKLQIRLQLQMTRSGPPSPSAQRQKVATNKVADRPFHRDPRSASRKKCRENCNPEKLDLRCPLPPSPLIVASTNGFEVFLTCGSVEVGADHVDVFGADDPRYFLAGHYLLRVLPKNSKHLF